MAKKSMIFVRVRVEETEEEALLQHVLVLAKRTIKMLASGTKQKKSKHGSPDVLNFKISGQYVAVGKDGTIAQVNKPCKTLAELKAYQADVTIRQLVIISDLLEFELTYPK